MAARDGRPGSGCKKRGFCPSCGARRMAASARHLVDDVFGARPVRQWVLSVPYPLRFLFAGNPHSIGPVLAIVQRAIGASLADEAGVARHTAQCGTVTLIQRFGSALNFNLHLHMLFLDGGYRHLAKQGYLESEDDVPFLTDAAASDEGVDALRMSSVTYRVATGAQTGRKVTTLQTLPGDVDGFTSESGKIGGFSLHAGVSANEHESAKLERLCRTITRPAVSEKRIALTASGQVRYALKTPWRDGATQVMLDPVEFLA